MATKPKPKGGAVARYTPLTALGASLAERLGRRPEAILIGLHEFAVDAEGMVDLVTIFRTAGGPRGKEPHRWLDMPATRQKLDGLAAALELDRVEVIRSRRGRGGFTKVHWHLTLAYAEDLDARQHVLVRLACNEQVRVARDPGLKLARAIAGYRRDGRDEEWLDGRARGKALRKLLDATMAAHGSSKRTHIAVSELANIRLIGQPARLLRAERSPRTGETRDGLTAAELATLAFFESQLAPTLAEAGAYGHEEILAVASAVADAILRLEGSLRRLAVLQLAAAGS